MTLDLRRLSERFRRRRQTSLLVAIVTAFAVRPLIGDAGAASLLFSLALLVLMLVALYAVQVDELVGERAALVAQKRRRNRVAWVLVLPALLERLGMTFAPTSRLLMLGSSCWLLFFAFVTWNQLRSVLRQREVTNETLSMAISVYLLLGFTWGILYIVIFQLQPEAFSFGASAQPLPLMESRQHLFPIFIYFSLTTLATIGYGDITPLSLQARYAAVAEGIAGQLYLAILVARLVGMHMSRSANRDHPDNPS
jgi:Ion channel